MAQIFISLLNIITAQAWHVVWSFEELIIAVTNTRCLRGRWKKNCSQQLYKATLFCRESFFLALISWWSSGALNHESVYTLGIRFCCFNPFYCNSGCSCYLCEWPVLFWILLSFIISCGTTHKSFRMATSEPHELFLLQVSEAKCAVFAMLVACTSQRAKDHCES